MYMHMQESMRTYAQKKRTPGHDVVGGGSRPNDLHDDRLNATRQCMHFSGGLGTADLDQQHCSECSSVSA